MMQISAKDEEALQEKKKSFGIIKPVVLLNPIDNI